MTSSKNADIVIVTCEYPPFPGGIGTYAGELTNALRDMGKEVFVIAPSYSEFGSFKEHGQTNRILGHHSIPLSAIPKIVRCLRQAPKDSAILAADIRTVLILYVTQCLHGRDYRVMVHGSEASKLAGRSPIFKLAKRAYMNAEFVAFNSKSTRDIFCSEVAKPKKEAITYLGVDPSWFVSPPNETFENSELANLPERMPLFCSIGRIDTRKGQLETVKAIAIAQKKYDIPEIGYILAGRIEEHSYAEMVKREARHLGVNVIQPGRLSQDDLKLLMRRSLAHMLFAQPLPGKIEGFGLVLLEAAAQGCPSIASIVGGIPEVLGDTGILIEPDDTEGLAGHIAELAADKNKRDRLSESAFKRAGQFNWHECAKQTFPELYHQDNW